VRFEWDPEKAKINLAKHRVAFPLATRVWDDPFHVAFPDRIENGEQRWLALGLVGREMLLVVAHSYPDVLDEERIRIISARKATPKERRWYEDEAF
jgi:uncharacterized DUF497 family protein